MKRLVWATATAVAALSATSALAEPLKIGIIESL